MNPETQLEALISTYFTYTNVSGLSANPVVLRREELFTTSPTFTNGVIILDFLRFSFPQESQLHADHRYELDIIIDLHSNATNLFAFLQELILAINKNNNAAARSEEWIIDGAGSLNYSTGVFTCTLVMLRSAEAKTVA